MGTTHPSPNSVVDKSDAVKADSPEQDKFFNAMDLIEDACNEIHAIWDLFASSSSGDFYLSDLGTSGLCNFLRGIGSDMARKAFGEKEATNK